MTVAFSVTREDRIYAVRGEIAVIGGKIVNEPYARGFRSRRDAEKDAARLNRINANSLKYLEERREMRLEQVREYLAVRAKRPRQLSLF